MNIINQKQITSQTLLNVISTLNDDDLIKVFSSFITYSEFSVEKTCKVTSYKCYESVYICNGKVARGFGRNEKEANVHCIRNLIQLLQGDDRVTKVFRECLNKMNDEQQFQSNEVHAQEIPSMNLQPSINQQSQQQAIPSQTQNNKIGSNSSTPYQNNPNSFHISHMDFRNSYENFYSESKQNPQHMMSVGNNNSATTPINQNLGTQNQQNHSSFSKYYSDTLNGNSVSQPANQFLSINKSMSQPHPEDYQTQQQQQNIFASQGEDYRTNTLASTSGNNNNNNSIHHQQQQLNTSINLQTTSQTNFYNNLQHSAPKEKPIIQQFANLSNDGGAQNSTSNKNSLQQKSSFEETSQKMGQAPLPQHRHSRNKSMNIASNYQTVQTNINLTSNPDFSNAPTNTFSTKSVDKDSKFTTMEEELKKSKNYIEHLERKIKLVIEENNILKSLLVENKKSNTTNCNKGNANNISIINTTNVSSSNLNNTYTQQSSIKQNVQTIPANENLPPSSSTFQNSQISQSKQPYFFPVGSASGNVVQNTQQLGLSNNTLNNSNININSNNYLTQQHNLSTSIKEQSQYVDNSNKKNLTMHQIDQQQKPLNQNNVLKDFNNKANIIANAQPVTETLKIKSIPHPNPNSLPIDENVFKITNEKYNTILKIKDKMIKKENKNKINMNKFKERQFLQNKIVRSLSVDINAKRSTLATDNSNKKLDTSLIETSQCSKMMGHTKYKNKIPKLNLQILPNYHGHSNKSINQQLLIQYQASQQKNPNKTEKQK